MIPFAILTEATLNNEKQRPELLLHAGKDDAPRSNEVQLYMLRTTRRSNERRCHCWRSDSFNTAKLGPYTSDEIQAFCILSN